MVFTNRGNFSPFIFIPMKLPKKKDFKKEVFKYLLPMLKKERKERKKETIKYIKKQEKYFLTTIYKDKTRSFRIKEIDAPIIGIKYMAMKYGLKSEVVKSKMNPMYFLEITIP